MSMPVTMIYIFKGAAAICGFYLWCYCCALACAFFEKKYKSEQWSVWRLLDCAIDYLAFATFINVMLCLFVGLCYIYGRAISAGE